MPSRRSSNDLVLFSSQDPKALVNWLCQTYGLQSVLQAVAEYRPTASAEAAPTKRAYKKRAKKGATKKGASKKGGKKRGRKPAGSESEKS